MPGLSFMCGFKQDFLDKKNLFKRHLDSLILGEGWLNEILLDKQKFVLASTKYGKYPIKQFENEQFYICIEGRIYNKDDSLLQNEIFGLAEKLTNNSENSKQKLTDWLLNTDGEFIVIIYHKQSSRIAIFNDLFSHLPAYYNLSDNQLVLSRSLRHVSKVTCIKEFDRMSMALYMIFLYYPFNRTFLKDIYRLEPATLIQVDLDQKTIEKAVIYTFNFEIKKYKNISLKDNADELSRLFAKAVKDRVDSKHQTVITLSGGMDSRILLAALMKEGLPFEAETWVDTGKVAEEDAEVAGKLAELFGFNWQLMELKFSEAKYAIELLKYKDGMCPLWKQQIVYFFNTLKQKYNSNIRLLTGNVGWSLRYTLQAKRKVLTLNGLARYIVSRNQYIQLFAISSLTGIPEDEIINEVAKCFSKYPEKNLLQKNTHFLIYERGMKFLVQGGDRVKALLWNTFPDFSTHFFSYAMNCPDRQKEGYKLYTAVLANLYLPSTHIGRVSGKEIIPIKQQCKMQIIVDFLIKIYKLPNPIRFLIKKIIKCCRSEKQTVYHYSPELIECMYMQINNCDVINQYLSKSKLYEIIGNLNFYKPEAVAALFTLISAMEFISDDKTSIHNFLESNVDPFFI